MIAFTPTFKICLLNNHMKGIHSWGIKTNVFFSTSDPIFHFSKKQNWFHSRPKFLASKLHYISPIKKWCELPHLFCLLPRRWQNIVLGHNEFKTNILVHVSTWWHQVLFDWLLACVLILLKKTTFTIVKF